MALQPNWPQHYQSSHPPLLISISTSLIPSSAPPGSKYELAVHYVNESNTDAQAPLLELSADQRLVGPDH